MCTWPAWIQVQMRVLPGSAVSRVAVVPLISVRHHDGTSQVFSKIGRYLTLSSFPETSVHLPWLYIFVPAGHTKPMNLRYCISNTTTPVRPRYCPKSVSHPSFWKLISSIYLDFSLSCISALTEPLFWDSWGVSHELHLGRSPGQSVKASRRHFCITYLINLVTDTLRVA